MTGLSGRTETLRRWRRHAAQIHKFVLLSIRVAIWGIPYNWLTLFQTDVQIPAKPTPKPVVDNCLLILQLYTFVSHRYGSPEYTATSNDTATTL